MMFSRQLGDGWVLRPARGGEPNRSTASSRAPFRPRRAPLGGLTALCSVAALLCFAPAALAHAQLLGTSPQAGSTLPAQPSLVVFKFNEAVGGTLGAVRVYDARGREVDDLHVEHPRGHARWLGVGLKAQLVAGTYTATYRVVSADTHIVYGGLVFNIGHASRASGVTVASLLKRGETGRVTKVAFGAVRALDYLSIALTLGGLAFLFAVWRPALARAATDDPAWQAARGAFEHRLSRLLFGAIVVGVAVSVLGVLLQGASAAGVSLWTSLKADVLQNTLDSRFGTVWTARAGVWLAIGIVLLFARVRMAEPLAPRLTETASRWLPAPVALGCAYLAITPALAGHASIEHPVAVFFVSDVVHVASASVWVGGIACLLLALPVATRKLAGPDRTRLLLATLARFSPLALGAVIAIAVTGVVQAYIDVRSLHGLLNSTYGALVIVKVALLLALIGLGWVNRRRVLPTMGRLVDASRAPRGPGVLARRTMRGELALMLVVLGVTAALVSYTPPIDTQAGPFSVNTTIGAAQLEMTLEPARAGANTAHLYLIDARTGAQFTATKELTVTASLPSKGIGPLALHATLAGPGHYIVDSAVLSPAGTWRIQVTDRVSEFEQHTRVVKVPIA